MQCVSLNQQPALASVKGQIKANILAKTSVSVTVQPVAKVQDINQDVYL
ncbi:hypothetical protein [Anabaena cylindrica]|uniref:Uncharacterized protein n=1 Tax=Trichormus variabilis NIES-23 TaxID=1973479 RepID=A0A1Z4KPD7_ANAVA|nr:hypothetical protein [Anabaena cylindrica]BAY70807.1 hypothetical protein NIES23_36150 [Trichormus variabilis NIES-23]